ncbi:MAG: SRPBCC family protein [Candidatus Ranarchaeia archaeon]
MPYMLPIEKDTRQTLTIDIEAPVELVWKVFVPDEKFAKVAPDFKKIEFITERKEGIGTMTRWHTVKGLKGRAEARIEMITEYKKFQYYSYVVLTGDPPRENTVIFLPIKDGTRVIFTAHFNYDVQPEEMEMRRKFAERQLRNAREKVIRILGEDKGPKQG